MECTGRESVLSTACSLHAGQTQQHHWLRVRQRTDVSRKTKSINGAANAVAVLRPTIDDSSSLCKKLGDNQVDATMKPSMTWHTHQTKLQHKFQFSNLWQPRCAVQLRHLHHHRHFLYHQASNNSNTLQQAGLRPLDLAHVFQRFHVLSCAFSTKFDAERVQMLHGVRYPAWSAHVRPQQQRGVAEPRSFRARCIDLGSEAEKVKSV